MISTEELRKRKAQLEGGLRDVGIALAHDEYTKPFHFKRQDTIQLKDLKSPTLKHILDLCIKNDSGFDPNLITQHIEHEALDQFNNIVKENLKGMKISKLMEMRYELELLMLRERYDHYTREIEKADRIILESVTGVTPIEKTGLASIDKRRKANKDR